MQEKWEESWFPGLGRSPGVGKGNPLQCSCLGHPTDRGGCGLQSMVLRRVRQDWATKQQHTCVHSLEVWATIPGVKYDAWRQCTVWGASILQKTHSCSSPSGHGRPGPRFGQFAERWSDPTGLPCADQTHKRLVGKPDVYGLTFIRRRHPLYAALLGNISYPKLCIPPV